MSDIKSEPLAKIEVDAAALFRVLKALVGQDHEIRELQYTRKIYERTGGSPIDILVREYNEWVAKRNGK